jgi:hypothetical protein
VIVCLRYVDEHVHVSELKRALNPTPLSVKRCVQQNVDDPGKQHYDQAHEGEDELTLPPPPVSFEK